MASPCARSFPPYFLSHSVSITQIPRPSPPASPSLFLSLLEGTRIFATSFANSAPRSSELPLFFGGATKNLRQRRTFRAPSKVMKAQTPARGRLKGEDVSSFLFSPLFCIATSPPRASLNAGQTRERESFFISRFYIAAQKRTAM